MRTVTTYHVEYAFKLGNKWGPQLIVTRDPDEAAGQANMRRANPSLYACVKVTGPHQQEVPE